jgi:hypothetical protein
MCDKEYPLKIQSINTQNKTFYLIQDTYLPAGTKQRGIKFFKYLKDEGYEEVVTHGTVYGYGQVAIAYCCQKVELNCTLFLPAKFPRTKMTNLGIKYGANVIDIHPKGEPITLKVLANQAKKYLTSKPKCKLLELGLDDPRYIKELSQGIIKVKENINPKRIWVAGGSGVLVQSLALAFPNTEFCIVQVGRKLPEFDNMKYTIYIAPEIFKAKAEIIPPYESLITYDAKVWRFVIKYGEDGDYIWNVK